MTWVPEQPYDALLLLPQVELETRAVLKACTPARPGRADKSLSALRVIKQALRRCQGSNIASECEFNVHGPVGPIRGPGFMTSNAIMDGLAQILEVASFISMGRCTRSGMAVLVASTERAADYAATVLTSAVTMLGELRAKRMILETALVMQLTKTHSEKWLESLAGALDVGCPALDAGELELGVRKFNAFHTLLIEASGARVLRWNLQ